MQRVQPKGEEIAMVQEGRPAWPNIDTTMAQMKRVGVG